MAEWEPSAFTARTYKAGGFLMLLDGVLGAIAGLALLVGGGASFLGTIFTNAFLVGAGAFITVFSVIEFIGGVSAYQGKNWYGSMTAGTLGLLSIVTLPLDLLALILVALAEGEFDQEPAEPTTT